MALMATPPNPLLIPTLTEIVSEGSPSLDGKPPITPAMLAEQVFQIVQPQIEGIIKAALIQVLEEQKRGV